MAVHRCESAQFQSHSPCMKASSPAAISAFHPGSCELNLWRRQNRGGRGGGRAVEGQRNDSERTGPLSFHNQNVQVAFSTSGGGGGRIVEGPWRDIGTTMKGQGLTRRW